MLNNIFLHALHFAQRFTRCEAEMRIYMTKARGVCGDSLRAVVGVMRDERRHPEEYPDRN